MKFSDDIHVYVVDVLGKPELGIAIFWTLDDANNFAESSQEGSDYIWQVTKRKVGWPE